MDFNFITAEHLDLNVALHAVADMYKKEFEGTNTRLFSTQVLQNIVPPRIQGASAQISFLVIVTIVNPEGDIVPLSRLPERD
jgi:hypothetical protein